MGARIHASQSFAFSPQAFPIGVLEMLFLQLTKRENDPSSILSQREKCVSQGHTLFSSEKNSMFGTKGTAT